MDNVSTFISDPRPYVPQGLEDDRIPSFFTTYTGKWVNPIDLQPEDVCIEDIAHHLSQQNRWTGGTLLPINVAQHSCMVSDIVPPEDAWDGLMHDGPEYLLQDMAKPLKSDPRLGQAYRGAEKRIERVLAPLYGINFNNPRVKRADLVVLVTEARDYHCHARGQWTYYRDVPALPDRMKIWSPKRAEREFLRRFNRLYSPVLD
jgi:hypothetical protein